MSIDKSLRIDRKRFGTGQQIGLMPLEKGKDGSKQRRIAQPRPQIGWIHACQRKQAGRALIVGERPGQRLQRQGVIINCITRTHRLSQSPAATRNDARGKKSACCRGQ